MVAVNKVLSPVIGALVGAAIVGGIWYGTSASNNQNAVVAKVDNTPITRSQLLAESESYAGSSMLSQLITNQLVLDAAQQQNIKASDAEVNQALLGLEQQNGITSDSQLNELLQQSHMTKDQLMTQLKVEVLGQKLAESKVKVTDKQIQSYYNKNKSSLTTPEKRSISDIVVKTKSKAQDIENQLKQGKDFATLAKSNSIDSVTKSKGGAMGSFTQTDLQSQYPEIASQAFKLSQGAVSDPIKVSDGYELIKVTKITPAKTPTLAQAKSEITTALKEQNAESPQQLYADLAKKANIQILDSSYASVKDSIENPQPTTMS
ncbi:peptidylprolyl isomerase [Alicyclobacillus acidoterrestris]|nr:peptidylprolyl isomerase [Alicyclobacillus acidoterrestris]